MTGATSPVEVAEKLEKIAGSAEYSFLEIDTSPLRAAASMLRELGEREKARDEERRNLAMSLGLPGDEEHSFEELANSADQLSRIAGEAAVRGSREKELREALEPFADIEECNGLKYGICQTRRCLVDGGWQKGDPDYSVATCKHRRAAKALEGK